MSNKSRSNPPWSDIPPEILLKIGELTGYPIHQNRIRAVCKSWRSAFAHVENRGIKNFPFKIKDHPSLLYDLFIVPTTSYVIQPVNGSFEGSSFLVTVDEIRPGLIFPRCPLSVSEGTRNSSKGLDLLENRVTVVYSGFSLRLLLVRGSAKDCGENKLSYRKGRESEKVLVCKNPCCEDDLLIIVLSAKNKLMAFRVGRKGKVVIDGKLSRCLDVVKFKDKIYGIDHLGGCFLVDYDYGSGDANVVSVAPSVKDGEERGRRLVVDSSSDKRLYMVALQTYNHDISFIVYKLKEDLRVGES